jgi:hypothetical protein
MLIHRTQGQFLKESGVPMMGVSANRYQMAFEPLSQRIAVEMPGLSSQLENLKGDVGVDDFEKYFESLLSLKKIQDTLWIVTDREFHRSLLLRNFLPQLKKAFTVEKVQILSQAN